MSTQPPLHSVSSPQPTSALTAVPIEQISPSPTALPQSPQCAGLLCVSVHASSQTAYGSHCGVCGTLIPRRAWVFDGGEGEIEVCSPQCEELYESYWRPTYGVLRGKPAAGA